MYCTKCGAEIAEGAAFCTNCGEPAVKAEEVVEAVEEKAAEIVTEAAPAATSAPAANPTPVLVMGIIAIATCAYGILGIIFGAIGKKKAKAYLAETGSLTGAAKVGSILAKVGLIVGIVMTVVWLIYIIIAVAAGAAGAFSYTY